MSKSVVVIGAGIGGLSAAIHSRLLGHDVLVLERQSIGGKAAPIESHGYRFDPGPSIVILTRIYEQIFRSAGRKMEDYLRFDRLDPISQVRFAGATLDLPGSIDDCARLANSLSAGDGDALRRLMTKLGKVVPKVDQTVFDHPFEHPWQLADPNLIAFGLQFDVRKSYRESVDEWFRSPLLRAFFYGFPSYGGQSYDSKAPGALLIPYYMLTDGVWFPQGGVAAIPAALQRLAAELGVKFATADVVTVETVGSRVKSVADAEGNRYEAASFISNQDRSTFGDLLGRPTSVRPSFSYFTLQWGLKHRPDNLRHHSLVIPSQFLDGFEALYRHRKFPEPPIVYLNEVAGTDPSMAPPGGGNLFAVITSPAEEEGWNWEAETPRFRKAVLDTLRDSGVDVEAHGIEVERVQTPRYFREAHGNFRGSLYGVDEPHRMFGGMFPATNRDPQFKNLFYSGGSVQPGAGMPMVALSGRFAAQAMAKSK